MNYKQFKARVAKEEFTLADLRCERPPAEDWLAHLAVLDLIDECKDLEAYERFVTRYEKELATACKHYLHPCVVAGGKRCCEEQAFFRKTKGSKS
jgi:hypothetical protein